MCLFPTPNTDRKSIAYKKGIHEFDCGACPECLAKRSRLWALRCSYEAKEAPACMITLTYDTFIYDENGNIIGENLAERSVDKEDAQKFLKRLRSHYDDKIKSQINNEIKQYVKKLWLTSPVSSQFENFKDFRQRYVLCKYKSDIDYYKKTEFEKRKIKIKYLLTAEYGKRTHRPHYHAILFGVDFKEDRTFYKKSKRGNTIFMSKTLSSIWNNGICTVDCVNVSSKVARYCTKYCAKDARAEDTFMLVSRGIGDNGLMRDFNGLYYMVDGREYPIPKLIWNKVILERISKNYIYNKNLGAFGTYSYVSYKTCLEKFPLFPELVDLHLRKCRSWFCAFRDRQKDYQNYLDYWRNKSELYDKIRGNSLQRILSLPNEKYFSYKQAALRCLYDRKKFTVLPIAPRANAIKRFAHDFYKTHKIFLLEDGKVWLSRAKNICLSPSRHIRANDRKKELSSLFPATKIIKRAIGDSVVMHFKPCPNEISPFLVKKVCQNS